MTADGFVETMSEFEDKEVVEDGKKKSVSSDPMSTRKPDLKSLENY